MASVIRWSVHAKTDIARLDDFLLSKDPHAALRAVLAIRAAAEQLSDFPRLGYPIGDPDNHRDLRIAFGAGAYIIRYRVEFEDVVFITRVWHSRETRR